MNIKRFKKICRLSQQDIKYRLYGELKTNPTYQDVTITDGFVFARGSFPVLLVAHMDTVHKSLPTSIYYNNGRLSAHEGIGGDDRCGIYLILEIIKKYNCSVLFTEDEEIGGVGAYKFVQHDIAQTLDINYIVELDRRGKTDAVFYDCDNKEFTDFICKDFFKESFGTFSDISVIAPDLGVAAVNFSSGYYNAHTVSEYVVCQEMDDIMDAVCKLLARTTDADKFKYVERKYTPYDWSKWGYSSGYSYGGYSAYRPTTSTPTETTPETPSEYYYIIQYYESRATHFQYVCARSEDEAIGRFLVEHRSLCYDDLFSIELDDTVEDEKDDDKQVCEFCGERVDRTYNTNLGKVCRDCYNNYIVGV